MSRTPAGVEPETNPEVERLLREKRETFAVRMSRRDRLSEIGVGLAFLAAAAIVIAVGGTDDFDAVAAVVLLLAYAAACRASFEIGGGSTDPTLLVLIPAFFVEPPAVVPLLAAGGFVLSRVPDYLGRTAHPERALTALGNSWHAIGPALVLALLVEPGGPRFQDMGWYVLAAATYVVADAASGLSRQWLANGVRPGLQLRMMVQVYALDALLAPVGLLAALATAREPYAYLLAAPLLVALSILARERGRRLDNALALAESRARVLEAELAAARTRVEVLGAVSHGLQTPVAGVVAIAGVLARRGSAMPGEAVAAAAARLEGDAVALRQVVRQALDYVRLVDEEEPALRTEEVDVLAVAREVTGRSPAPAVAEPDGGAVPVTARADAVRVHQILTALLARALSVTADASAVRTAARRDGTEVELTVREHGDPAAAQALPALLQAPAGALGTVENQGTGIDLFVAERLAGAMGGSLTWHGDDTPGVTVWVLRLPAG